MVGPTTLQPGESVTLDIPLHMGMHVGMGGKHEFAIDIKSNDPVDPVKTVKWEFFIAD